MTRVIFTKSLFFKPKDMNLARKISIRTPGQFNKSIDELRKNGITKKDRAALILARTRAKVQLKRKNLSTRERNQMLAISKTSIPRVNK